jgi:hypothetical protein
VSGKNLKYSPPRLCDAELDNCVFIAIDEILKAKGFDHVTRADSRVVCLINEPKRENTLLLEAIISGILNITIEYYLQVGLMDTSEGTRDNHRTTCGVTPKPSSTCMKDELVP